MLRWGFRFRHHRITSDRKKGSRRWHNFFSSEPSVSLPTIKINIFLTFIIVTWLGQWKCWHWLPVVKFKRRDFSVGSIVNSVSLIPLCQIQLPIHIFNPESGPPFPVVPNGDFIWGKFPDPEKPYLGASSATVFTQFAFVPLRCTFILNPLFTGTTECR